MKSGCVFRVARAGNGKCDVVWSPLARGIRVWASKEGLPNRRSAFMRLRNRGALRTGHRSKSQRTSAPPRPTLVMSKLSTPLA